MKISSITIILFLVVSAISCNNTPKSHQTDFIIVKGNIKGFDGKTLYAKNINAISYQNNSILDSALVDNNGDFDFKISKSLPLLLNFSKNGRQHPIHELLQKNPDKYYYGYCSMYYIPEPTLYLTDNLNIQLDWTVSERIDSYNFDLAATKNQVKFYDYYLNEDISKVLYEDDGFFKTMDSQTAWNKVEAAMNEALIKYEVDENTLQDEFNNYLKTEIKLGSANMYLNWYEYMFAKDLEKAFASDNIPELYAKTINMHEDFQWNTDSVEFYKMTERFITFNLNKSIKEFKDYYPTSERKISIARDLLKPSIADEYVSNIDL